MTAKIYYDSDADLSLLKGKTIAILGYGSQGHAQAQNLRDSGCTVIIGQRPGSPNYDLAVSHGFEPMSVEDASKRADLINILLPDEVQADIYRQHIRPNLVGRQICCSVRTDSTSISARSKRRRASTRRWSRPRVRAIWSAANSSAAAACPA